MKENQNELAVCSRASWVVGVGAAIWIAGTFAIGILIDALTIYLVPIILLLLLPGIRRGSVSAATWTLVIIGLYLIVGIIITVVLWVDPGRVSIGNARVSSEIRPYATLALLCVCVWAAASCWLTWCARQAAVRMRWRQERRCGKCGYDLTGNVSGRCPECGTTIERKGESA